MSGFDSRIKKARLFEDKLFITIESLGFCVAINGTEHTHPSFVNALKRSGDQTSLAIRFQPDGVAQIGQVPRSFYVEAKAAKTIERTAYEQYMKLSDVGNIVVVVFRPFNWRWCFVSEMPLIDGNKTVEPFPLARRFPVVDGWLYPKKTSHGTGGGSDTPYREIDEKKLRSWDKFKDDIIKRLEAVY